jgi:hypothetical protein
MEKDHSPTIDDIKKRYKYEIDPLNFINYAYVKYSCLYGAFFLRFEKYDFEEKIKEIKNIILKKGDKIPKNTLDSYEKILKDITEGCKTVENEVDSSYHKIQPLISRISDEYEKNKDIPGASDIYQKIGKQLIDDGVKTFIKNEKILVSYNDYIINIKNNLTN